MEASIVLDPNQIIARTAATAVGEGIIVKTSGNDGAAIAGASPTGGLLGVNLYNATVAGESLSIANGGIARVKAGAAVARDAFVTSDSTGRAVTATLVASGATYIQLLGQALEACDNANEFIAVKITLAPAIIA